MKLIFKIYKKVRELRRKERELITHLESKVEKLQHALQFEKMYRCDVIKSVGKRQNERQTHLNQQEKKLRQRERDLDDLQQKINDQILKLGIVKGVKK